MSDVRVSVALCTYQGERYLQEQLDSIAEQTLPPDEVIVCDDHSTDGTVGILERFRSGSQFPVNVHVNAEQLGLTKNFERAICLCKGDIIFLADQDDVWHPEKLSTLVPVFATSPEVGAVFSDAHFVDEDLSSDGRGVWEMIGFTSALQRKFAQRGALDVLLKRQVVSGMTMAFRARFRDLVIPIPRDWIHDRWISVLIAAVADIAMVPRRLVKYRQHDEQATKVILGILPRTLRETIAERQNTDAAEFLRFADQYAAARRRLSEARGAYGSSPHVFKRLEAAIGHMRARADMRNGKGRFPLLMKEALSLNYGRFSNGWKSIAMDAFLS
jgi:glycosyltransferase involved in cell wall biosynthesis